jgi:lipid A 3-O-deacylase
MKYFIALILLSWPMLLPAVTGEAVHLYVENDTRRIGGPGSDNAYSSGLKLSYISAEDKIPGWAEEALERSVTLRDALKGSQSNFGLSLGHQMYTPNNTQRYDLIEDDRPYAAWLYVGFSAHFQSSAQSHSLELDVGVIGPEAMGKPVQNNFHDLIGTERAEGWQNQLSTEPTLQLSYQQRLKFVEIKIDDQKYVDVIPFFGGGLGNVSVDAHVGGMVRIGNLLQDDFGPARPSMTNGDNFVTPIANQPMKTSFYLFASAQGYAIARNIFLDGNSFRPSHHVTKYPFVLETEFGAVGHLKNWSASWRFVSRSPEFEQKSVVNSFASISIGYSY